MHVSVDDDTFNNFSRLFLFFFILFFFFLSIYYLSFGSLSLGGGSSAHTLTYTLSSESACGMWAICLSHTNDTIIIKTIRSNNLRAQRTQIFDCEQENININMERHPANDFARKTCERYATHSVTYNVPFCFKKNQKKKKLIIIFSRFFSSSDSSSFFCSRVWSFVHLPPAHYGSFSHSKIGKQWDLQFADSVYGVTKIFRKLSNRKPIYVCGALP